MHSLHRNYVCFGCIINVSVFFHSPNWLLCTVTFWGFIDPYMQQSLLVGVYVFTWSQEYQKKKRDDVKTTPSKNVNLEKAKTENYG